MNVVDDCTEREEMENWMVVERVMLSVDDVVLLLQRYLKLLGWSVANCVWDTGSDTDCKSSMLLHNCSSQSQKAMSTGTDQPAARSFQCERFGYDH